MEMIEVEVAYARPDCQRILTLSVPIASTVEKVIELSGIRTIFPEIDLRRQKTGIFSEWVPLTQIVKNHDRIEIYRPLLLDPKEARRQRVLLLRKQK